MTSVILVCPKCQNQEAYDKAQFDLSKELTCSACGFSELPARFELAQREETKSWQVAKVAIIIVAGIVFVTVGLYIIIMLVWIAPILFAALIIYELYKKSKNTTIIRQH
jgi:hypothetical protein